MEQSFIAFLEDSIKKNWDLDALTSLYCNVAPL